MNQNFYNSNSSGFDQFQPPQYSDVHQPPEEISIKELKTMMQSYCEIMSQRREQEAILLQEQAVEEKQELLAEEQAANHSEPSPVSYFNSADYDNISTPSTTYAIHLTKSATIITNPSELTRRIYHNHDIFYDGDDDEELFLNEVKRIQQILERTLFDAITPDFSITDSLSMGDEHLSTISKSESDELIKSSVENLVPTPSESEDLSDIESECNVPVCDDFTTFCNPLFDADDDFSSCDDESFSDDDVSKENFKIYSNPLFDKEIISSKIDPYHFNAESDFIESLLNRDISTVSYPKIDYLLKEFSGELTHINLIPPGIKEADFDPEEEFRLIEELLYDNSSPRPPKESNSKISDATIKSFSPSPIPVEDSDSLIEEIDLFLNPDDSIPPGIKSDDYDSDGDILFLEELLNNDSFSFPKSESSHFNHYDVPSSPRPLAKPPDDGIFFDFEPDTGVLTAKVVEDISEHYVLMPKLLPTQSTLCPYIDTLLPFSSENEDKVFNHGILASHLLSHRDFNPSKTIFDFSKSPMMIHGGDIPISDVPFLHFYPP
ncbi:hypothetical protein Tco_1028261 [Tanacetum coccineum]|uniref:Reverse transcriptase domain-containing protein n=1 Tax=Tanacetum coccineum TaxID=301880 RepID=A0ABQ5G037_9ASTR